MRGLCCAVARTDVYNAVMMRTAITVVLALTIPTAAARANDVAALETNLNEVNLDNVPAQRALEWLAVSAGFNLVINWDQLEAVGYDRNAPVTVKLRGVKAKTVLKLMLSDIFHDVEVLAEVEPAYVRVRTKAAANKDAVVKTYSVADLLFTAPTYRDPPEFDLDQIASDSEGSGGSSIFTDDSDDAAERVSLDQRVQRVADAIRNNIEPDIWQANGGLDGKITYANGQFIIRAPEHVHQRIGLPDMPVRSPRAAAPPARAGFTTDHATPAGSTRSINTASPVGLPNWGAYKYRHRLNRISKIDELQ